MNDTEKRVRLLSERGGVLQRARSARREVDGAHNALEGDAILPPGHECGHGQDRAGRLSQHPFSHGPKHETRKTGPSVRAEDEQVRRPLASCVQNAAGRRSLGHHRLRRHAERPLGFSEPTQLLRDLRPVFLGQENGRCHFGGERRDWQDVIRVQEPKVGLRTTPRAAPLDAAHDRTARKSRSGRECGAVRSSLGLFDRRAARISRARRHRIRSTAVARRQCGCRSERCLGHWRPRARPLRARARIRRCRSASHNRARPSL